MQYTLYKNPVQLDTLSIVQYLHFCGQRVTPTCCIERNHPSWVTQLPSIETSVGDRYIGLEQCTLFYEAVSGKSNLLNEASVFKTNNPHYRIH